MIKLNIQADTPELQRIKEYLQENVSDTLAEKINNGTPVTKDGKKLISRKDLKGFMHYASEEAKKLAEKGAQYACIEDKTVFGWAIHYFEEDSIEGTLYNEDGTEYKPPRAKPTTKVTSSNATTTVQPKPQPKPQMSLFDFMVNTGETEESDNEQADCNDESIEETVDDTPTEEPEVTVEDKSTKESVATIETESKPTEETEQSPKLTCSPHYKRYTEIQSRYPNSVIAYRVGDFYEVFGDNAVEIANLLGFTLTGRDCGLMERVPMCGFPYHASEKYFDIISKKRSIAVVEISGVVRQIAKKQDTVAIDYDTGEIMTEEEMREFDGDISEPKELTEEPDSVYEQERKIAKAFDKETLIKLYEILGDIFIVR